MTLARNTEHQITLRKMNCFIVLLYSGHRPPGQPSQTGIIQDYISQTSLPEHIDVTINIPNTAKANYWLTSIVLIQLDVRCSTFAANLTHVKVHWSIQYNTTQYSFIDDI